MKLRLEVKSIRLHDMASAVDKLASQASHTHQATQEMLGILLKTEIAEREVRSINYQMRAARFPVYRDLVSFDFAQSKVNKTLVRNSHKGVIEQAHNVVLVGGLGTDSTHIATAISVFVFTPPLSWRRQQVNKGKLPIACSALT